ncbi:MAG TPA: IS5 family transposase [Longimicrobiaceae bacterium]|nr:IS5 family transposase [Longimicrobiaceae bacterium]
MRGSEDREPALFSYVALEDRIPRDHPLRTMKTLVDGILQELSPRFDAMYARVGRPSIPPEQLMRALLLQIFYSVRSERLLMEQLDYNLLFRWFVGLSMDERVWVATTFTKNRDRLLAGEVAQAFFAAVREAARRRKLLSDEHFTVDGTLLEAWASQKSFRPREEPPPPGGSGRNPEVDFRGEKRSNQTHQSRTDPDARLYKKGSAASKLCYAASALMENRHGFIVDTEVGHATGTAEWESALAMLRRQPSRKKRRTLGADKHYDTKGFVQGCRALGFTPHVAQNTANGRPSAIDGRTTRHAGHAVSQRQRKLVEQGFGWAKTVGLLHKLRHRGKSLVGWIFAFTSAAYNLVRLRTLIVGEVSR